MYKTKTHSGFTLIEMIVSLGVFSIVVTTAVGAILVMIATNQRLQGEQSVMSNLSFALDNMTREIRTGTFYNCITSNPPSNQESLGTSTSECVSGGIGLSFVEGGDSLTGGSDERVMYYYDSSEGGFKRQVGNDSPESIVSGGIVIQNAVFTVTGSDQVDSSGDVEQPTVTLYVEAISEQDASSGGTPKVYQLQTTITQRVLDL